LRRLSLKKKNLPKRRVPKGLRQDWRTYPRESSEACPGGGGRRKEVLRKKRKKGSLAISKKKMVWPSDAEKPERDKKKGHGKKKEKR